jgi:hypothetical protein
VRRITIALTDRVLMSAAEDALDVVRLRLAKFARAPERVVGAAWRECVSAAFAVASSAA